MKVLRVFSLLACVRFSWALPLTVLNIEEDPELTAGYIEGDMVPNLASRNGLRNEKYRWPDNKVYYRFFDEITDQHRNHILRGMQIIQDVSCIRFEEASPSSTIYVNITTSKSGCSSSVGYLGRVQNYNVQLNRIDVGCFRLGTIVHEFLHTLGFYHMQSASNRDEYVHIAEENVQDGKLHNFNKYNETVDNFDQEYDYSSVLHYSAFAFSANGEMTIIPLKDEEAWKDMGQRRGMTRSDINKLNLMYRCPIGI